MIGGCWPHCWCAHPYQLLVASAIGHMGQQGHHPGRCAKGLEEAGPLPDSNKAIRWLRSRRHGNHDADN